MVQKFRSRLAGRQARIATIATLAGSSLMMYGSMAHATAPTPPDYAAASTAFADSITPIVTTVLPIAVGIMAIVYGPKLFKRLVKSFASG